MGASAGDLVEAEGFEVSSVRLIEAENLSSEGHEVEILGDSVEEGEGTHRIGGVDPVHPRAGRGEDETLLVAPAEAGDGALDGVLPDRVPPPLHEVSVVAATPALSGDLIGHVSTSIHLRIGTCRFKGPTLEVKLGRLGRIVSKRPRVEGLPSSTHNVSILIDTMAGSAGGDRWENLIFGSE